MRWPFIICGFLSLFFAPRALAGETVSHPELKFRFTLPDGFESHPERAQGDALYVYFRQPKDDRATGTGIVVLRRRDTLGRNKFNREDITKQNAAATFENGKWKNFDIPVARLPEEQGGARVSSFVALVPLTPEAIQFSVVGDEQDEAETRALLHSVLATVEGDTNWLSGDEKNGGEKNGEKKSDGKKSGNESGSPLARGIVGLSVFIGSVVAICYAILYSRKKKDKQKRNSSRRRGRDDEPDGDERQSRKRDGESDEDERPRRKKRARDDEDDRA